MFSITISISLDGPRYLATGSARFLPRIIRGWNVVQAMYPNITGDIRLKDIINGTK